MMALGFVLIVIAMIFAGIAGTAAESNDKGTAWVTGFVGAFVLLSGLAVFGRSIYEMTKGMPNELNNLSVGAVVELVSEPTQQDKNFLCFVKVNGKDPWAIKLEQVPPKKGVVVEKNGKKVLLPLAEEAPPQTPGVTIPNPLVPPVEKK